MTISTTTNRVTYTGDGTTTAYTIPFLFYDDSHMQAWLDNVQQSPGTYSITGAGNPAGGTLTFNTAPAAAAAILLLRVVPHTQLVDYQPGGPFPSESHEIALDLAAMGRQQLDDSITNPPPGGPVIVPGPVISAWTPMSLGNNWVTQPGRAVASWRTFTYPAPGNEVYVELCGGITANNTPANPVVTNLPAPNVTVEFAVEGQGQGNAFAMCVITIDTNGDMSWVRYIPSGNFNIGSGFSFDGGYGYFTVLPTS